MSINEIKDELEKWKKQKINKILEYEKDLKEGKHLKGIITIRKRGKYEYPSIDYYDPQTGRTRTMYIKKEDIPYAQKEIEQRQYIEKRVRTLRKEVEVIDKALKPLYKSLEQENVSIAEKLKDCQKSSLPQPPTLITKKGKEISSI